METKLEYLLDSGNILNMFEIEKCSNKIIAFQNTQLNIGPTLHCSVGKNIFFGLFLP